MTKTRNNKGTSGKPVGKSKTNGVNLQPTVNNSNGDHAQVFRGGQLSSQGILRALQTGLVKIWKGGVRLTHDDCFGNKPIPGLSPAGMDLHVGSVVLKPPRPSLLQKALQTLVLQFGVESLRPWLKRYAIDYTISEPQKILAGWKKFVISENEPFILLPGEFVLLHSLELVEIALKRQEGHGDSPLVTAKVGGKSRYARVGVTAHFSANDIYPDERPRVVVFEVGCFGEQPVMLHLGTPFAQLTFCEMESDPGHAHGGGAFSGQESPCGNGRQGTNGHHH